MQPFGTLVASNCVMLRYSRASSRTMRILFVILDLLNLPPQWTAQYLSGPITCVTLPAQAPQPAYPEQEHTVNS